MIIDYVGVKEINGSLIVLDGVKGVSNEEIVDIRLDNGTVRQGRVVQIEGEKIVVQVFEGTRRISPTNTRTRLTGHPMEMPLSPEIIGRVLDGAGRPIDGLGDIFPVKRANINGTPINPVSRIYPKNYINTGISTIDTLMTLIRGQKLPIFSGTGMKHNDLAVQIVRQAKISGGVAEFEIPALNASDYPSLPVTGADNTMTMKCGVIREMIEKTIYAVSQDDKKPAHTGELFVIEPGSLTVVALDGYRLAIIQRDVECTRDIRIIIPSKTLQELLKIMGGADDDVKIDANRRYVVFTTNGYTIMSRLIEGDFLNYESVIPKDKKTRITVDCKTFIDTIERASLIITERLKNPLRISFTENKITVRCQTPLGKVVDEFAPVEMTGDPVEIGFNNRYLLDALRYSKCEKMVLEINGPLSPVKILPENGKDFIYLVLPVRFKNEG